MFHVRAVLQVQYRLMWSWGVTVIYVILQIILLAKRSSGYYVVQESLLGAYIGTQLVLFAIHAAVWHYLPAAQLRCAHSALAYDLACHTITPCMGCMRCTSIVRRHANQTHT